MRLDNITDNVDKEVVLVEDSLISNIDRICQIIEWNSYDLFMWTDISQPLFEDVDIVAYNDLKFKVIRR